MRVRQSTAAGLVVVLAPLAAQAQQINLFGVKTEYTLQATYALALRAENQSQGIVDGGKDPRIGVPDFLKVPAGVNFDDGDRNFNKGSLINNRLTLLGETIFKKDNYGLQLRGDIFYDDIYHRRNDNNSPDTVNKSGLNNQFTGEARHFDGGRARLLEAYVFGTWQFLDDGLLNLRVGQQVVSWGESLFFSGVSLAQGPADGAAANVPGADVKGILLPVQQIGLQAAYGDFTLLGQYKLGFKQTEINPVGEYFSVSDALGPGAQFVYGIRNPLFLNSLSGANLLSNDLIQALNTIGSILGAPPVPEQFPGGLPPVNLPTTDVAVANASPYVTVKYLGEVIPTGFGQYGVGLKYQLTEETDLGLYHLRYTNTIPAPVFTYGFNELAPAGANTPAITTEAIGLRGPVTYQAVHQQGIHLTAASFSTVLFGANVAGEFTYRDGIDVLVNVDGGILGPIPTPTQAKMLQADLNAIYLISPNYFWDSIVLVADVGFIHVGEITPVSGPDPAQSFTGLTYSRDASAYSLLASIETKNVFQGWDLAIPLAFQSVISGHSSLLGGFGSLGGNGDMHASMGVSFTRLQKLSLGLAYNAFLGSGDYTDRPLADRDFVSFNAKYGF